MNLPVLPMLRALFARPAAQCCQSWLLSAAALALIAGNLAYAQDARTTAIYDLAPLLFAAAGVLMVYAALRARFLDPAPIALPEILARLPDGLVVLDQRGIVIACNDAAPALLAVLPGNWTGQRLLDVVAGSPLEIDLRALLAQPAAATRHLAYERADGMCTVELRLRPLFAGDTRAGTLLVFRNRTEWAKLEEACEQQARALSVLNRIACIASRIPETDELLRAIVRELARAVPSAHVVAGLQQADGTAMRLVADDALRSASIVEDRPQTGYDVTWLQRILQAGQPCVMPVAHPQLAQLPAQVVLQDAGVQTVAVVPLAGPAGVLGAMFFGYADQRAIAPEELQLLANVGELVSEAIDRTRHTEEIYKASQAKSMLLAMVSHELRTPLSSIIGFIDMFEHGLFGVLSESMRGPVARMRHSSMALLRLINDVLDFSKIEAGQMAIERGAVDLATVIWDVAGALQPQIRERGLALTVAIAPGLPQVYASSTHLRQVLTNLLANAIKFTDRGSITVRALVDGERVRFSVADTGIGIAPEQQHLLFQEFRQIENEHTRRYGGTGLGLAISQRLMQLMGGTLAVESAPGVGSTFYGEVPIASEHMREREHNA